MATQKELKALVDTGSCSRIIKEVSGKIKEVQRSEEGCLVTYTATKGGTE